MTDIELIKLAEEADFRAAVIGTKDIPVDGSFRKFCEDNLCGKYNANYSCPPGCGTLEEISVKAAQYKRGVLLQTTGQLEDDFDVEVMMESEQIQKDRFKAFVTELRKTYPNCLPMSSGACTMCPTCTYPDAPCRAPHLAIPSMEAYGLFVTQVCRDNGMPYHHGPKTITYTACVLF